MRRGSGPTSSQRPALPQTWVWLYGLVAPVAALPADAVANNARTRKRRPTGAYFWVRRRLSDLDVMRDLFLRLRAVVVLGPISGPLARVRLWRLDSKRLVPAATDVLGPVDVDELVDRLDACGFASGPTIDGAIVDRLVRNCAPERGSRSDQPHKCCDDVREIALSPGALEVARRYLGVEPVLWSSAIYWRVPEHHADGVGQRSFHYDMLDFRSVSLFVYLTDVDQRAAPHSVVLGTHREPLLRRLWRHTPSNRDTKARYGPAVHTVTGPRGTTFFEDTSCYHQISSCRSDRLSLKIDYVVQRREPAPRDLAIPARLLRAD